jgi:hypothetical protein
VSTSVVKKVGNQMPYQDLWFLPKGGVMGTDRNGVKEHVSKRGGKTRREIITDF